MSIALLQWLLPARAWLRGMFPAWASVRAALYAVLACSLIGGGAIAGVWAGRLGEPQRIAAAAKPLCDAAAAAAQISALESAVAEEKRARRDREGKIIVLDGIVAKLEKEQADAREKGPQRDDVAVPGDSTWLQRGRAVRKR